jgi:hypothetical protein
MQKGSRYTRLPFLFGAQNEIRTRTILRMPPPQDGASTNFATWAGNMFAYKKRFQKK